MTLTITDVCERLDISRSTATRWLKTGRLAGVKKHRCGATCTAPDECKQTGAWTFTEDDVRAALAPTETGR